MSAFYNENDPKAAAWLRELIKQGHIAPGVVDERSITEIKPDELHGYTQCHFFAGIGGWSLALRLAGWPDERPVWTGSCPCQPFSAAGKQRGAEDERHLWPAFFSLILACGPGVVYGEQVASAAVLGGVSKPSGKRAAKADGPVWLDGVFADLESAHYACGAADLPAAGVGAPHIRQRVWWVAYANGWQSRDGGLQSSRELGQQPQDSGARGVADVLKQGLEGHTGNGNNGNEPGWLGANTIGSTAAGGIARDSRLEHPAGDGREQRRPESGGRGAPCGCSTCRLGDAKGDNWRREQPEGCAGIRRSGPTRGGAWSDFDIIPCTDGKARRVESGTFPLAHGVPGRVGLLRGYGNAIVPQLAAEFILASLEAIGAAESEVSA